MTLTCATLIPFTPSAPALAQSVHLTTAIADSRERLDLVRADRARLEAQALGIGESLRDAAAALANIERRVSASIAVVAELRLQTEAAALSAIDKRRELAHARDHLAVKKASLHRRARDIYKAGPLRSARALFGASSPTDLITRYRYLQRMADADRSLLDRVRELERRLTAESALLEEHLTEVSRLRLEGLQEAAQLGAEEAEREAVVATFRNREGVAHDRLAQLTADEDRMAALVADLETRQRAREAAARLTASRAERELKSAAPGGVALPPTGAVAERANTVPDATPTDTRPSPLREEGREGPATPEARTDTEPQRLATPNGSGAGAKSPAASPAITKSDAGTLPWPVEGDIAYSFGRERRSDGTVLRWAGLGISASPGTPVTAVAAGTVELAGRFEGYGNTVVLGHGDGIYTLYLYLDEVGVVQGRTVVTGEQLGTVGGHNTPEGPHLEFQVRVAPPNGPPLAEDPLTWLTSRR